MMVGPRGLTIRYFEGGGETEAHVAWQPPADVRALVPTERIYPYK